MIQIIYLLLGLVILLWIYHYSIARTARDDNAMPSILSFPLKQSNRSSQETEIKEGFINFKGMFNKFKEHAQRVLREARERAERLANQARERAERLFRERSAEKKRIEDEKERQRIEKRNKLIADWKENLKSNFNMLELIPPGIRDELAEEIKNAEKQKCLYYKNEETERKGKAKKLINNLIDLMEKLPQSREDVRTIAFSTEIYNIRQPEIVNRLQQSLYGSETNFNKDTTTQLIKMLREYNPNAYDTSKC